MIIFVIVAVCCSFLDVVSIRFSTLPSLLCCFFCRKLFYVLFIFLVFVLSSAYAANTYADLSVIYYLNLFAEQRKNGFLHSGPLNLLIYTTIRFFSFIYLLFSLFLYWHQQTAPFRLSVLNARRHKKPVCNCNQTKACLRIVGNYLCRTVRRDGKSATKRNGRQIVLLIVSGL